MRVLERYITNGFQFVDFFAQCVLDAYKLLTTRGAIRTYIDMSCMEQVFTAHKLTDMIADILATERLPLARIREI